MKVFVANLNYTTTEDDLRRLFEQHGTVVEAAVARDPDRRSKGFAFITMGTVREGQAAIKALSGTELQGRTIRVEPSTSTPRREAARR